ncbi:conserved phage C-terminal domain-containing protein [Pararhizobium sp.]|uniref:conserved phage C-terminal domain-containing protein n=1 Tax=Pararhizobium sp. TaxID=1977563 RepID=UPI003D0EB6C3
MSTFRVQRTVDSHFTIVPHALIRHPDLSPKAKAVMVCLLSYGSGEWTMKRLQNDMGLGKDASYAALDELMDEKAMYVRRYQPADSNGRFSQTIYEVSDCPYPENPDADDPDTENADALKRTLPEKNQQAEESFKEQLGELLDYLNAKTGRSFRDATREMKARLKSEGIERCRRVIDVCWGMWGDNDDMRKFVNTTTPFRANKFDCYLQMGDANDEPPEGYHWDDDDNDEGAEPPEGRPVRQDVAELFPENQQ